MTQTRRRRCAASTTSTTPDLVDEFVERLDHDLQDQSCPQRSTSSAGPSCAGPLRSPRGTGLGCRTARPKAPTTDAASPSTVAVMNTVTLATLLTDGITARSPGWSTSTQCTCRALSRRVNAHLGQQPIGELSNVDLDRFYGQLRAGIGPGGLPARPLASGVWGLRRYWLR